MPNLVMTDFNQQSINALNKGIGIGNQFQKKREIEIQRERQAQQDQQQSSLFGQKTQMNQQSIAQQETLQGMSEMVTALNLPYDKRNKLFATLESRKENPEAKKFLGHLQTLDDKEQLSTMLNILKQQQGGVGTKDNRLDDIKKYEYYLQLKKERPEDAEVFGRANDILDEGGSMILKASDVNTVNKGINGLIGEYKQIRNTAKDLDKLSNISSGPAQIAMIFKFMKALDPTSVVREGEFATAENSAGVPERISNMYNKIVKGERLTPTQMEEFVNVAKTLSNSKGEGLEDTVSLYLDTYDINPKRKKSFMKTANVQPFNIKESVRDLFPTPSIETKSSTAPKGAIDYLLKNPDSAEQFKAKYGYLPRSQ